MTPNNPDARARRCPCRGRASAPCALPVLQDDTLCAYHRERFAEIDRRSTWGLRAELAADLGVPFALPRDWTDLGDVQADDDGDDG